MISAQPETEGPVSELRRLYRETEAKAARLRLIVDIRSCLDRFALAEALPRALETLRGFTGASGVTLDGVDDVLERQQAVDAAPDPQGFICASGDGVAVFTFMGGPSVNLATEDREAIQIVVDLVAAAVSVFRRTAERDHLLATLARREQELENLVGAILTTQERERARIAYDLHDGVAQSIVSLLQHLQSATADPHLSPASRDRIDHCGKIARSAVRDIRHAIADLRPAELDDLGLSVALRAKAASISAFPCHFRDGLAGKRLAQAIEIVLYRVAQEALTNAQKHAACSMVLLELHEEGADLVLRITDDGVGMPDAIAPRDAVARGCGIGISAMRERLVLVGGRLALKNGHPGTIVEARISLEAREHRP
jgi:signal transduction histidine kinase